MESVKIYMIEKEKFEQLKKGAIRRCTIKSRTYIWTFFVIPKGKLYDLVSEHLELYDGAVGTDEDDQYYKIEENVNENWIQVQTGKKLEDFTEV